MVNKKPRIFVDSENVENPVLGFPKYAEAISNIILDSEPNFTLGIFGEWGTGKTTLMNQIQKFLNGKVEIIQFNAWRFAQEQDHATYPLMLTTITELLELSTVKKKINNEKTKRMLLQVLQGLKFSATAKIPLVGEATMEADLNQMLSKPDDPINNFIKINKPVLSRGIELIEELISEKNSEKKLRIVIFVDDLDRCTPEKAAEILESIKIFFNISGIVFVLGLSKKIVEAAIDHKYRDFNEVTHQRGGDIIEGKHIFKGSDYIKKIIQVPFTLPEWTPADIDEYLENLLSRKNPSGYESFFREKKPLIQKIIQNNPREVKRLLNNFIVTNTVFQNDASEIDDDKLFIFQILSFKWKEFYDELFLKIINDKETTETVDSGKKTAGKKASGKKTAGKKASGKKTAGKKASGGEIPTIIKNIESTIKQWELEKDSSIKYGKTISVGLNDKLLREFLNHDGKIIFQLKQEEWKQYRRATSTNVDIKDFNAQEVEKSQTNNSSETKIGEKINEILSEVQKKSTPPQIILDIVELTDFKAQEKNIPGYTLFNLALITHDGICMVPVYNARKTSDNNVKNDIGNDLRRLKLDGDAIQHMINIKKNKDLIIQLRNVIYGKTVNEVLESSIRNYFINKEDINEIDMYFRLKRLGETPMKIKTRNGD